ncbi:hypothetical protein ACFU9V_15570, partial [Streptomyces sp. NPDC057557]
MCASRWTSHACIPRSAQSPGRRALEAFYTGTVWREHRDAANAIVIGSNDVLLLRGPVFAPESGTREVVATVCQPSDAAAFDAYAARRLGPRHALHLAPTKPVRRAVSTRSTPPACPPLPPPKLGRCRRSPAGRLFVRSVSAEWQATPQG